MCGGIALFALICVPTLYAPAISWDALSHWMFKAKALLHHRTLAFSMDTHHNEYPLLWPLHTAMQYVLAGGAFDELAKWTVALLLAAMLGQLHGALRFLEVPVNWAWAALLAFPVFFFEDSLQWAYAETLFLALLAAMLAALAAARAGDARWIALAVFFGFGLAGTKFEGGPACVIVAVAAVLAHPRFPLCWRPWALGAALALPLLLTAGWFV